MSDGVIVLASVFALVLIHSGTRIVVAMIQRRPSEAARLAELERRLAQLAQQLDDLQAATDLTERALGQLADAQRFTESLLKTPHAEGEPPSAPIARGRGHIATPPSNVRGSGQASC